MTNLINVHANTISLVQGNEINDITDIFVENQQIKTATLRPDTKKYGSNEAGYRTKAAFIKRPQDPEDEKIEKLYKIRPYRLIEQKDMDEIWPEWNSDTN
jgi:hypothetical protein